MGRGGPQVGRKRNRHVVPNAEGGWDVRAPEAERASDHLDTQEQAIMRAREIVANAGGGEVVIHAKDGRIREAKPVGARASEVGTGATKPAHSATGATPMSEVKQSAVLISAAIDPDAPARIRSFAEDASVASTMPSGVGGFDALDISVRPDGVFISGLSTADAVDALMLLRAARLLQYESGTVAARGLLHAMTEANVELIPPASVEQARRLASLRKTLLSTPVFTTDTLGELRGDVNPSTTRTWISRARERGSLFTVKFEGKTIIPALQLSDSGAPRDEYSPVLAPLLQAEIDGWTIWTWLTSPTPLLSGRSPADLVSEAPERVSYAARRFASSRRSAA
ncbi:DUF2188 domain-containing protein [Nocardioides sp. BGMRC 2183]|nr:DUF2188 domain-containing protein [Nocardioides sp. BGMRC 2183]